MSKVLSYDEYEKLKISDAHIKRGDPDIGVDQDPPPPVKQEEEKKVEYFFFHPDSTETGYVNGKYFVETSEGIKELEIKDGVIKTDREEIKNILIQKGFSFMYQK